MCRWALRSADHTVRSLLRCGGQIDYLTRKKWEIWLSPTQRRSCRLIHLIFLSLSFFVVVVVVVVVKSEVFSHSASWRGLVLLSRDTELWHRPSAPFVTEKYTSCILWYQVSLQQFFLWAYSHDITSWFHVVGWMVRLFEYYDNMMYYSRLSGYLIHWQPQVCKFNSSSLITLDCCVVFEYINVFLSISFLDALRSLCTAITLHGEYMWWVSRQNHAVM